MLTTFCGFQRPRFAASLLRTMQYHLGGCESNDGMCDYSQNLNDTPKVISNIEHASPITEIGSTNPIFQRKPYSINETNDKSDLNGSSNLNENIKSAPIIDSNVDMMAVITQKQQTTPHK